MLSRPVCGTGLQSTGSRHHPLSHNIEADGPDYIRRNAASIRVEMVARTTLIAVLVTLAKLMGLASRISSRFRAALSQDLTIALETKDGASYHFVVRDRRVRGARGRPDKADFLLRFTSSGQALVILFSPAVVGKLLRGVLDRSIEHEGSLVLLLWFDGRIQQVAPLREPIRRPVRLPGAYVKPRDDIAAAKCTLREPAKAELDSDWTAAWEQRRKLDMMRVAAGEPHKEF